MIERNDRDGIAVLRMAHGKASALDVDFCERLAGTWDELAAAPPAAVVLTGTGSIFSAGVDLPRVLEGGTEYLDRFLPALDRAFGNLLRLPVPVVAAVNGHAIAGGCVLVSCCDLRIMARGEGTIGVPELRVGVPFPVLALEIMRMVLPPQHLQAVVYTGRNFAPDAALRIGLVDEVVDPGDLEARALEAARELASISPRTFAISKQALRRPVLERVQRDAARFDAEVAESWRSPAVREAIRDHVARTIKRKG